MFFMRSLLIALLPLAYDLGQDVTLCWRTNTSGGDTAREDCEGAHVNFSEPLPSRLVETEVYSINYSSHVPPALHPTSDIPHANIHSCLRIVG